MKIESVAIKRTDCQIMFPNSELSIMEHSYLVDCCGGAVANVRTPTQLIWVTTT